MIVEIEVTLILDTEDRADEAADLVRREISAKGLIAGRVCAVIKAYGHVMHHEDAREYLKP
jgi:hypothetical protein